MRSNYEKICPYIRKAEIRNSKGSTENLLGVSVSKAFMPSIANTVGTDFTSYRVVKRNQFTYIPDTSRRGDKIGIALLDSLDEGIVSQAYTVFEISDKEKLDPQYLMMWFRRPEFDRYARYISHGSVREIFEWEDMCNVSLPIPSITKQREIVAEYNTIQDRIKLNEQLIQKLELIAKTIFESCTKKSGGRTIHRLGDFIEIKGGFSYNSEQLGTGETYLLGMGCVSFKERFVEEGMRLYSDDVPVQHMVKQNDIIIATRQQSDNLPILGCPAMIPPNFNGRKLVIASNLYRVVNKSCLSNEIIYQVLKSKNYQEHIKLHTKGTTVGMITKDAVENYVFEAPPIESLFGVQKHFDALANYLFIKRSEKRNLIELKHALLSKLATIEN